jgi:hypothetical protein
LIITWVLKLILECMQLRQLCFTILYPLASLLKFLEPLHHYSNSNMRIWVLSTIGLILFLFSIVSSTKVNPMIIPIHQDHLDPISCPSKSCLSSSHILKLQLSYLSRCVVSQSKVLFLLLWCWFKPHHSTCAYFLYPIESLNHILKYHSSISNPMPTYSCSPILHYSIYKWVNWLIQCFTILAQCLNVLYIIYE